MVSEQHPEQHSDSDGRAGWHLCVLESDTNRRGRRPADAAGSVWQRADTDADARIRIWEGLRLHHVAGRPAHLPSGAAAQYCLLTSAQEPASREGHPRGSLHPQVGLHGWESPHMVTEGRSPAVTLCEVTRVHLPSGLVLLPWNKSFCRVASCLRTALINTDTRNKGGVGSP